MMLMVNLVGCGKSEFKWPNAKLSYPDQALAVGTSVWWNMKTSGKSDALRLGVSCSVLFGLFYLSSSCNDILPLVVSVDSNPKLTSLGFNV